MRHRSRIYQIRVIPQEILQFFSDYLPKMIFIVNNHIILLICRMTLELRFNHILYLFCYYFPHLILSSSLHILAFYCHHTGCWLSFCIFYTTTSHNVNLLCHIPLYCIGVLGICTQFFWNILFIINRFS